MLLSATQRLGSITSHIARPYATAAAAKMTDTSKYKFNHSMIRVKDPHNSVSFYEHLGMKLIHKKTFPDNKFDLYFLAYGQLTTPLATRTDA